MKKYEINFRSEDIQDRINQLLTEHTIVFTDELHKNIEIQSESNIVLVEGYIEGLGEYIETEQTEGVN